MNKEAPSPLKIVAMATFALSFTFLKFTQRRGER